MTPEQLVQLLKCHQSLLRHNGKKMFWVNYPFKHATPVIHCGFFTNRTTSAVKSSSFNLSGKRNNIFTPCQRRAGRETAPCRRESNKLDWGSNLQSNHLWAETESSPGFTLSQTARGSCYVITASSCIKGRGAALGSRLHTTLITADVNGRWLTGVFSLRAAAS